MAKRKSKEDVNYTDLAPNPEEMCEGCKFFINGEACAKVVGRISLKGGASCMGRRKTLRIEVRNWAGMRRFANKC